jgi:ornithine cyclodeaminase
MLIVDIPVISKLIEKVSLKTFYQLLVQYMREDFLAWDSFHKTPRVSFKHPNGILELMPVYNQDFFANKYVCTHKDNHLRQRYVVMGQGLWVDAKTGTPLMIAEMTILTALRTAAVSLMVSQMLVAKTAKKLAVIGCGAQSHFQVLAHLANFNWTHILAFDTNTETLNGFVKFMADEGVKIEATTSIQDAVKDADLILTLTNANRVYPVLKYEWLKPGVHINAIGGDAPGMSELDIEILHKAKLILIEYHEQTLLEGEIQQLSIEERMDKVVQISEFIKQDYHRGLHDLTVFDGVGIALLDYSCLRLLWDLCQEHQEGQVAEMLPPYHGDKNLYKFLKGRNH